MLCTSYLSLAQPPVYQGKLRKYSLSEEVSSLFCERCSCQVFLHHKSADEYLVASGVLQHNGPIIKVLGHRFIGETSDGGLAKFMSKVSFRDIIILNEETGEEQVRTTNADSIPVHPRALQREDKLLVERHCGDVRFFVTSPNPQSEKLSSPWPDVLVPYHSTSSKNAEDIKWWLRQDNTKYLTGLCTCRSCRLSAGFPIQARAFIPRLNIISDDAGPFAMNSGYLRRFESSSNVYRESCKSCGATVFWHSEERPDLINVSVGLLRAQSGARAETWLEWDRSRVSFVEEAVDQELARALEEDPARVS
jgi:hypothetical protein